MHPYPQPEIKERILVGFSVLFCCREFCKYIVITDKEYEEKSHGMIRDHHAEVKVI